MRVRRGAGGTVAGAALAVVLGATLVACTSGDDAEGAADAWAAYRLPAAVTLDPDCSGDAVIGPGTVLCGTSDLDQRAATDAVVTTLEAEGLTVEESRCQATAASCSVTATDGTRTAELFVQRLREAHEAWGEPTRVSLELYAGDGDGDDWAVPTGPNPDRADAAAVLADVLPAAWGLEVECTDQPEEGACSAARARTVDDRLPRDVWLELGPAVSDSDLTLTDAPCQPLACHVSAERYEDLGFTSLDAWLRRTGDGATSVRVTVSTT